MTDAQHAEKRFVFYNHGVKSIFISHDITPSPDGLAGSMERKIVVRPGEGIDVRILGLRPTRPEGHASEQTEEK